MRYRDKFDLGTPVKIITDSHALKILKTMSYKTWIYNVPNELVELVNSNFDIALESVKYVPNIYFKLDDKLKKDKCLIKETIRSFYKHNRINEINLKNRPLTKKIKEDD